MENKRIPKPGEIYTHNKDKPYQIITVATQRETGEAMVVYQDLYGDFKAYVRPLEGFLKELEKEKIPDTGQERRLEPGAEYREDIPAAQKSHEEIRTDRIIKPEVSHEAQLPRTQRSGNEPSMRSETSEASGEQVNQILLQFLDAESYHKKLGVISSNIKHMDDRLINDIAVSLDCTVEEGPLEKRVQELIFCLNAMCRFEDRRLR